MEIFLFSRFLIGLPMAFLLYVGAPFKYGEGSAVPSHWSNKELEDHFKEKKWSHYNERIAFSFGVLCCLAGFLSVVFSLPSVVIPVLMILMVIVFMVDGVLLLGRYLYYTKTKEKAENEGRTDLVAVDFWKDTSIKDLLKIQKEQSDQKEQAREKAKQEGKTYYSFMGESRHV